MGTCMLCDGNIDGGVMGNMCDGVMGNMYDENMCGGGQLLAAGAAACSWCGCLPGGRKP